MQIVIKKQVSSIFQFCSCSKLHCASRMCLLTEKVQREEEMRGERQDMLDGKQKFDLEASRLILLD